MIQNHMTTPTHPGAMTPLQVLYRDLAKAATIAATAAILATFATIIIMFI